MLNIVQTQDVYKSVTKCVSYVTICMQAKFDKGHVCIVNLKIHGKCVNITVLGLLSKSTSPFYMIHYFIITYF